MRRSCVFSIVAACAIFHASPVFVSADAQQWNDERARTLVRMATDRRAQQLADSGLVDYHAAAHGYLTFLAQLGEGFREPPQVVKADELALEVYWRAPNLSKQRIVGRRDTTLLPTDIQYHQDHLGIVQNNFPAIIRLGDGDEVQDVPHPLSVQGLRQYDFAISDSLRIAIPGRVINVYEVKVRPKNDQAPRVIGALYLDRDNGQVVRMALSFTRAAFLDKQLEDLFIVLENGLVGTQFWLPRRQEIEIRRTASWLDYPVRGIIRGRWDIGDYQLNTGISLSTFAGPEIVQAPPQVIRSYEFSSARILDSLPPDVRAVTAEEIRRVQLEARALVREQALRRAHGTALAARAVSDFARFNRVEGTALGAGLTGRLGKGFGLTGQGRFGIQDHEIKGTATLHWQSARGNAAQLYFTREYRDAGATTERSTLINSIAAQEFASDYTDPFDVQALGIGFGTNIRGLGWTLRVSRERHDAQETHAVPASGLFVPPVAADSLTATRAQLGLVRPTGLWLRGAELRAGFSVTALRSDFRAPGLEASSTVRAAADVELQRPIGRVRLVSRTIGTLVGSTARTPVQELAYLGGPITAPGYDYHTLVGDRTLSQRVELQLQTPFPSLSLGRFGRSPASMTVTPFGTAAVVRSVYPSAGIGFLLFFDLLRIDVARGLNGGRWSFYLDVNRAFWSVL